MEIPRATLAQVRTGRDGRRVLIDNDVLDIARQIAEIDPCLHVSWNERGEYFAVYEVSPDGSEHLVTTTTELTPQLVELLRMIGSRRDLFAADVAAQDRQAERDAEHAFHERVGPVAERLAHALRKDLQAKNRAFVPGGM